jgi:hypothetical protein
MFNSKEGCLQQFIVSIVNRLWISLLELCLTSRFRLVASTSMRGTMRYCSKACLLPRSVLLDPALPYAYKKASGTGQDCQINTSPIDKKILYPYLGTETSSPELSLQSQQD